MVCRWHSKVFLRRSCWSSNICHNSTDGVFTTNYSFGSCCARKSEGTYMYKDCVVFTYV